MVACVFDISVGHVTNVVCRLQVYRGILRGMSAVAVKEVNSPNQHHQERFLREIALMRGCYDENIVAFRGAIVGESRTLLVMQYMENGNLYNLLATAQSDNDWSFRWYGRWGYFNCITTNHCMR